MVNETGDAGIVGRPIPGTVSVPGGEFIYVSDPGGREFASLFEALTNNSTGPRAGSGGAIAENCRLRVPDGRVFNALSYKGDLDGWRFDLHQAAQRLGLQTGLILNGALALSEGVSIPLGDCTVLFY
jgi:hypothetical protein